MKTIRSYVYAALLAATAFSLAPSLASGQEIAHGKFTLTHEVHLGNAKLSAGDYAFSFDPNATSRMLSLSKLTGVRSGYMVLVPDTEDTMLRGSGRLILESTPEGSYVSAMQLPEFGMTLYFTVPAHATEKQIAKVATTAMAAGQ